MIAMEIVFQAGSKKKFVSKNGFIAVQDRLPGDKFLHDGSSECLSASCTLSFIVNSRANLYKTSGSGPQWAERAVNVKGRSWRVGPK
jgi:hypothetical protein